MAVKYVSIFEYMKKYELPKPLWIAYPDLEQDSKHWNELGYRISVRRLTRFLASRSKHDKQLYSKLFPTPVDWDDVMPKEGQEQTPEDAFVGKRKLRLRKWDPDCTLPDSFAQEDALCIRAGDCEDQYSPVAWESFQIRLQKGDPETIEVYSMMHLLMTAYALYQGNVRLCDDLQLASPNEPLWKETLQKCMSCRTPGWKELLPHLLGLGLYRKFTQNEHLRELLRETGDMPIVYIDPDDTLLGGEFKDGKFCGQNLYGIALMQVRSELNRIYDNLVFCMGTGESEEKKSMDSLFDFPF